MKAQLVFLALVGFTVGLDYQTILNYCANPPPATKELPKKLVLPENYKISGSVTDWSGRTTALLKETGTKETRVLEKLQKDVRETWIQELSGKKVTTYFNSFTKNCDGNATSPPLFNVSRFDNVIGNDTSSIASIVNGLINSTNVNGFLIGNEMDIVGGVNAYTWVACLNATEKDKTTVLLEVRYAGEDSIPAAIGHFDSPLFLSVRLAELTSFNSTVSTNHWSVEVDRYEDPVGDEAAISHGVFCTNRTRTSLKLKPLEEYAAILNYVDYSTNQEDVVEVLYSKARQVFVVAGSAFLNVFKKPAGHRFTNRTDYVLHDFKYGYEFAMSQGACESFIPLGPGTADVNTEKDYLTMHPMEQIIVDHGLTWTHYQDETDMSGNTFTSYRSVDGFNLVIYEIHVTKDLEVHSMNTYSPGANPKLLRSMSVTKVPVASSRLNLKAAQLSDCYVEGNFNNNTWIVAIKDKNLTSLSKVGLNNLNDAVFNAITKNVHAVIPYRLIVFYVEGHDGGLSMVIRLAEKTEVIPGPVPGYNFTSELPTADLLKLMNQAILAETMPIEVQTVAGTTEKWSLDGKSMKMFPENESGFLGYTGGAMFVLAIFCLLIGVSIGAVGVFVVTRRQRISTLAYQVFE